MTQRRLSWCVVACLATMPLAPAQAQTPQEDARREYQRALDAQQMEQQRRAQEDFANRQKATEAENRRFADSMKGITSLPNPPPLPSGGNQAAAVAERARKDLEKQPPLPPQKNPLLGGQWTLERKAKPKGGLADLDAMVFGAACQALFGDGTIEFRANRMVGFDRGIGETDMGEVEYRAVDNGVAVLPKKVIRLLMFQIKGPDRIEDMIMKDCTFVRVGGRGAVAGSAPAAAAAAAASAAAASTAAGTAAGTTARGAPNAVIAAAPPSAASPAQPAAFDRSVCQKTLVDRLGQVRLDEARQAIAARFKETLSGNAPNAGGLRLDARGSPCDDRRLNATLYDFDTSGVLQEITFVWARPAGPAPAPIFSERIATLSRFHQLPNAQSPSRLQADTSLGRLILQDMPERNLLLEAYKTAR